MKKDLKIIIKFQTERDWKQFHTPKNVALSLSIEAAEILEIFQWSKDNHLPEGKKVALAEELADVYYYLLLLGHETGIDIKKAFAAKMRQNAEKYPVSRSKGKSLKYTEYVKRNKG